MVQTPGEMHREARPLYTAGAAARWYALAEQAVEPNPFYHPALLIPALDHLNRSGGARVIEAEAGGALIGLLPVEPRSRHGRFPFANVMNWTHEHCFFGAPLLARGREEEAWALLLTQLDATPWAGAFLHLVGQDDDGPAMAALRAVCRVQRRAMARVHRFERAKLDSPLTADAYWDTHVRAKKRKELRRLSNRLEELGTLCHRRWQPGDDLTLWTDDFLTLEASGWKGAEGTALGCDEGAAAFFRQAVRNAADADMLDMLRIDLDGRAIAMLVNFRHAEGGYSYKIAIDENYGRFSPGVLVERDNLALVLEGGRVGWMDSCAMPGHPMIDSLWAERRTIAQYRIALRGPRRALTRQVTDLLENSLRLWKGRTAS